MPTTTGSIDAVYAGATAVEKLYVGSTEVWGGGGGGGVNYLWDFEDGLLPAEITGAWAVSSVSPIAGAYSLKASTIGANSVTSSLMTLPEITAPAEVGVKCKVSSESGWDKMILKINGVESPPLSGENSAHRKAILPAGVNTLEFFYSKDTSTNGGQDTAWVDDITLVTRVGDSSEFWDFEDGLVPPEFTGTWIITSTNPITGTYSMRSAPIGGNQSTTMSIPIRTTARPATLSFQYKFSTEATYDTFYANVDGVTVAAGSGTVGPTTATYALLPGGHTPLTFSYQKDYSGNVGSDCVWVDNISIVEDPE